MGTILKPGEGKKIFNSMDSFEPKQFTYEDKLFDKVAIAAMQGVIIKYGFHYDDIIGEDIKTAFEYAEAFMAERSKRLKK